MFGVTSLCQTPKTLQDKGSSSKDPLIVSISFPNGSGLLLVQFSQYQLKGDTFFHKMDYPYTFDTTGKTHDTLLEKFQVDTIYISELRKAIDMFTVADSSKDEFDCEGMDMGWPRFFIGFTTDEKHMDCFIANVYREKYYNIVDIFNSMWASKHRGEKIMTYNKKELIQREEKCKD